VRLVFGNPERELSTGTEVQFLEDVMYVGDNRVLGKD
jgi:hypothetical protein